MRTALLLAALVPLAAAAQPDAHGTHDHPAVKRWPGAALTDGEYRQSETFRFPLKDGATKKVDGTYLFNIYRLPPRVTCAQVTRHYEGVFKGFALHSGTAAPAEDVGWPDGKWISAEGNGKGGGQLFAVVGCPADNFEGPELFVWVIENLRMQPPVEPDAAALADALTKNGRVALYGITFVGKKTEPTADSGRALEQLAALLAAQPDWKLHLEGHSDNAGAAKVNLVLSKKRAEAVKAWLTTKHGVDAARLTTEGLGDKKPRSPNTTELGRANNRRIELSRP